MQDGDVVFPPPPADWTNRFVDEAFSFPGGGQTSLPMTGVAANLGCEERMSGRWQRDDGGILGGSATAPSLSVDDVSGLESGPIRGLLLV